MISIEERFWSKVQKGNDDECWNWVGAKLKGGYGNIKINGKTVQAHRFSYELHTGKIPIDKDILHHCDNTACVNPRHLFLGDDFINVQDKINKGRQPRGEDFSKSKLKDKDVLKIRSLYSSGKYTMRSIAKLFDMGYTEINSILNKRTWRHI